MRYQEFAPPPALGAYVHCLWVFEGEDAAVELLGHGWCPPPGGDDVDPADGYVVWCPPGTGRRFGISATGSATVLKRLTAGLDLRICSHTATPDTRQCKS